MRGRSLALLACVVCVSSAATMAAPLEQRAATAEETAALAAYVRTQFPRAPIPALHAVREQGARRWTLVSGPVDLPGVRGIGMLCKSARIELANDGAWRVQQRAPVAWLNAANCAKRGGKVIVGEGVTDKDVVVLLGQYGQILTRARLLVAGHSRCAAERSSRYYLQALRKGPKNFVTLDFSSDRPVRLSIHARPNGTDFDAWEISCEK
jgi:hypothetical protein